jgi:hypothetical protein
LIAWLVIAVFAAERATFQVDGLTFNVVAKAESAKTDSVLTIARRNVCEFLDWVRSACIVRVGFKNVYGPLVQIGQFGMARGRSLRIMRSKAEVVRTSNRAALMLFVGAF